MSRFNELVNMLATPSKKTSPYDSVAIVTRVTGDKIFVHIPGGVTETPVDKTVDAKVGDVVQIRVGGGRAWITGNSTNPPTDDTRANSAHEIASSAVVRAEKAIEIADNAGVIAEEAVQQSDEAIQQASASLTRDTLHYLATTASSGVTIDTPGWTTTIQNIDSNKRYLWTYHTYTKVSGATSNTQPVITGVYGQTGATITSVTELYALNDDSNTAPPDSAFSENWSAPTANQRYLWNMERITYSDGNTSNTTKHILLTYTPGVTGRGIASITEYYALTTDAVEPPTSDFSTTVPTMTSTSKYMWNYEVVQYTDGVNPTITDKRIIGVYGDTGLTGKSLVSITEYYARTNSTTAPADGAFDTTVKSPTASEKYVWNYELMTWNDNGTSSTTRTDKHIVAVYGDKGNTGKSLTGITEYYARNNSTSAPADSAFNTTVKSPTSSEKYVWNYELMTWNDNGTTSTTQTAKHIVAVYGDKGDQGVSITSVQPQYYMSNSASDTTGGSWGTTLNWTTGKYIWTRDLITYSNNSTNTSTPVYNAALTTACVNAANAYAIAQDTNQYFWHTESGTDTGTHITEVSQSDFETDPQNAGGNLLARSNGVAIRKGLTELATLTGSGLNIANENGVSLANFGTTARVGRSNSTRFVMNAGSLQAYDDTNTKYFEVSPTGLSFGDFDAATTDDIPTKVSDLTNDKNYATTTQVGAAKSEAISAAATDATNKANAAQSAAATDATNKANAAQSAAATDATNKANAAQSAAATDATNKANEAAKTATNYLYYVDSANGLRVYDGSSGNKNVNFAQINSNGMQVYKGGTALSNMLASFGIDSNSKPYASFGGEKAIIKYAEEQVFGLDSHRIVIANNDSSTTNIRHDATLSSRQVAGTDWKTSPVGFVNSNHKNYGTTKYGQVGLFACPGNTWSGINIPSFLILQDGTGYGNDVFGVLGNGLHIYAQAFTVNSQDWTNLYSDHLVVAEKVELAKAQLDDLESTFYGMGIGTVVKGTETSKSVNTSWTTVVSITITKGVWVIFGQAQFPTTSTTVVRKRARLYNTTASSAIGMSEVAEVTNCAGSIILSTQGIAEITATGNTTYSLQATHDRSSTMSVTGNIRAVKIA